MKYVYLYGMILATTSFLLKNGFVKPDDYAEIAAKYRLPGGETGTCATVLDSLGVNCKMDGNHIGYNVCKVIKDFYKDKKVDLDSLFFDDKYEGLEDYVIIGDGARTPMGTFQYYYSCGEKRWNTPKESDIKECQVAAIDPYFGEETELAARLCVEHHKPYVAIDCPYDSYLHQNAAISIISGEGMQNYPGKTKEEIFPYFTKNTNGLTIITNGSKGLYYGRGQEMKTFMPYKVNVVSTLGAGDCFKAGCVYALLMGMNDDEVVRFATACSSIAVSRFPLPLNPPTISEVDTLIKKKP